MTCLVALKSTAGDVVLFSDSQASSGSAEHHGWQKQVAVDGALVAVAGAGDIGAALLEHAGGAKRSVRDMVQKFLADEVTPIAAQETQCIVADARGIALLSPARFSKFRDQGTMSCVGSGFPFVAAARSHDVAKGLARPMETVADLLVYGTHAMDTANTSLTVDDKLLVGLLRAENSYLLGTYSPLQHATPRLHAAWNEAIIKSTEIIALAKTIESEVAEAHRIFSKIRAGTLDVREWQMFRAANASVAKNRAELDAKVADYQAWYDSTAR